MDWLDVFEFSGYGSDSAELNPTTVPNRWLRVLAILNARLLDTIMPSST